MFSSNAFARDKWTKEDTNYQLTLGILKIVDIKQTKKGTSMGYEETNQFLSDHPSDREIERTIVYSYLIHTGIAYVLPKKQRRVWQCVFIGINLGNVYRNYRAGIRIQF
jgi:hypothetical protein